MPEEFDYSLLISMRDSRLMQRPRQLSRDRNLKLIIELLNASIISKSTAW